MRRSRGLARTLACTVGGAVWVAVGAVGGCTRAEERPRHVILLTVDTLRADALGAYGNATVHTPHIDALAARGTRFDAAMAPMPRTTPSLGTLMTGLSPRRHRSLEVGDPVEMGTALAQVLAGAGFTTLAVSGSGVAGPQQRLDRGFDRFVTFDDIRKRFGDRLWMHGSGAPPTGVSRARAVTLEALRLVGDVGDDPPVFLWVHYMDPHVPYRPPSPWYESVDAPRCWELYQRYAIEQPDLVWMAFTNYEGISEAAVPDCRKLYDAEVESVDGAIGELLAGIEARGWLEDALVVFTADHGESFGENGSYFEHGETVHGVELRVPLAIASPGIAGGRSVTGPVALEDVLPTVLAQLGLEPPERGLDGLDLCGDRRGRCRARPDERPVLAESANVMRNQGASSISSGRPVDRSCVHGERFTLCDALHGEPIDPPWLFEHVVDPGLEHDVAAAHPEEVERLRAVRRRWPPGTARQRAVLSGRFKLVEVPRRDGEYDVRLYDLRADPAERVDVSNAHRSVVARLAAQLAERDRRYPIGPAASGPIDPDTEAALRALQYVD